MGGDPVAEGLVKSFNRPGGNVTGSVLSGIMEMEPKRLEVLRELVPGSRNIGAIIDLNFRASSQPVSYTHLTLPTILRV